MYRALACRVVEQPLAPLHAGYRTGVHDARARLHVLESRLRHVEVSEDVGAEGFLPLLIREFLNRFLVLLKSSIVDQNIQLAELLYRLLHRLPAKIGVRDVAGDQQSSPAFILDS